MPAFDVIISVWAFRLLNSAYYDLQLGLKHKLQRQKTAVQHARYKEELFGLDRFDIHVDYYQLI